MARPTNALPARYLMDEELRAAIAEAISVTRSFERDLKVGIWKLSSMMVCRSNAGRPDKAMVEKFSDSLGIVPRYWSVLEVPFYSLVNELASVPADAYKKILLRWGEVTVRSASDDAFNGRASRSAGMQWR